MLGYPSCVGFGGLEGEARDVKDVWVREGKGPSLEALSSMV